MRSPDDMWSRQAKRADLAEAYWALAGGRPGFRVADVGCGPGFFSLRYAMLTGPTGHVHAVDADEDALAYLSANLDAVHHAHVTTELLDITRAPLPVLHFDAIFCTDMLHHADDIKSALRHMRIGRARLVIGEFDPRGPGDFGPPLEDRLDPDALTRALREAGWKPEPWRALAHEHYGIVSSPVS